MWYQFDNAKNCTDALVTDIRFLLEKALIQKGHVVMAVSGGRSPILLFQKLNTLDIPWEKIHITLVDERYVKPDHEDSNERLVRQHLLQNQAARTQFTGLAYQTDSLDADVEHANAQLPDPDIVVLGMGEDGHIASLFPYATQLKSAMNVGAKSPRYAHITPPTAPYERITMTLAGLHRAECLILEISGHGRHHILDRASVHVSDDLPISHILAKNWSGARLQVYWHP